MLRPLRLLTMALLLITFGCTDQQLPTEFEQTGGEYLAPDNALQSAIKVQNQHNDDFLSRPGIVGVGTGLRNGRPHIVLYAVSADAARGANLPDHVGGFPLSIEVTGPIVALAFSPTAKNRPAPAGSSVGHPNITAGTLGAVVTDGPNTYILSNNHVLADVNKASLGDPALQPGPYDGGTAADKIGTLHAFVPISFSQDNTMDAAIAKVDPGDVAVDAGCGFTIKSTAADPALNQKVRKCGRTTGDTKGTISETNLTVSVCYKCNGPFCFSCSQSARFTGQVGITPGSFSSGGDSGSLIVTDNASNQNDPVALLFAGSSTRTIGSPIQPVFDHFGVSIGSGSGNGGGGDDNGGGGDDPPITLAASGYKVKGVRHADLAWSGTTSANILGGGSAIVEGYPGTTYTHNTGLKGSGSITYQVCESGTTECSAPVTVTW